MSNNQKMPKLVQLAFALLVCLPALSNGFPQQSPLRVLKIRPFHPTTALLHGHPQCPPRSTTHNPLQLYSASSNDNNYDDIAFGFVLLGSLALTQDFLFAGTFLALSAVAAIATRQGTLPSTKAVPAAVAGMTLVVSLLLRQVVPAAGPDVAIMDGQLPPQLSSLDPALIQVGLCTVSMVYGFVMAAKEEQDKTME